MTRKTKKQKIHARQSNTLSWTPRTTSGSTSKSVKRELDQDKKLTSRNHSVNKSTSTSAKDEMTGTLRHDIYKTLAITMFILGTELVLYWAL